MDVDPEIKFAKNNRKGMLQDGKHGKRAEVCDQGSQNDQIHGTAYLYWINNYCTCAMVNS